MLAYRNEIVSVPDGEFICPECHKPLQPVEDSVKKQPFALALGIFLTLLILIVVGFGAWLMVTQSRLKHSEKSDVSIAEATPASAPETKPSATPAPTASAAPADENTSAPSAPLPDSATATAAPNLDLKNDENRKVKDEVLKRIDLMPTISSDNKDKLYVSVERARQMGKIVTIPFGKGNTALASADVGKLKEQIHLPQLQQLLQDPTCVFVVLGFADPKGDEKTNLRISQERATNVLQALRDQCGIINVMHSVAMGGSTLLDAQGLEKNRAAEVWAVLP